MPCSSHLTCTVEISPADTPVPEMGTITTPPLTTTHIPALPPSQPFSIHLTSTSYIAPGLAIFVYIDGRYQCNRFRDGLRAPRVGEDNPTVDFRVRAREEGVRPDGLTAREWRMSPIEVVGENSWLPEDRGRSKLGAVGLIEVVVLRLHKGDRGVIWCEDDKGKGHPGAVDLLFPPQRAATRRRAHFNADDGPSVDGRRPYWETGDPPGYQGTGSMPHDVEVLEFPKPYWTTPPPTNMHAYPEAPTRIPGSLVGKRSHSITGGRAFPIVPETGSPSYMDGLDRPYAIFAFRYGTEWGILESAASPRTPRQPNPPAWTRREVTDSDEEPPAPRRHRSGAPRRRTEQPAAPRDRERGDDAASLRRNEARYEEARERRIEHERQEREAREALEARRRRRRKDEADEAERRRHDQARETGGPLRYRDAERVHEGERLRRRRRELRNWATDRLVDRVMDLEAAGLGRSSGRGSGGGSGWSDDGHW